MQYQVPFYTHIQIYGKWCHNDLKYLEPAAKWQGCLIRDAQAILDSAQSCLAAKYYRIPQVLISVIVTFPKLVNIATNGWMQKNV